MNGGPPTIDIWDLKPGAPTGGPSQPISTAGDMQITDKLPEHREAHGQALRRAVDEHPRGGPRRAARYYMHTGYVPNPNIEHPSYGSVVAHELERRPPDLEIPPFVSIGGGSEGTRLPGHGVRAVPGRLVSGRVRNLQMPVDAVTADAQGRLAVLDDARVAVHQAERRGMAAVDHAKVLEKTRSLLTSEQMKAFNVQSEPTAGEGAVRPIPASAAAAARPAAG